MGERLKSMTQPKVDFLRAWPNVVRDGLASARQMATPVLVDTSSCIFRHPGPSTNACSDTITKSKLQKPSAQLAERSNPALSRQQSSVAGPGLPPSYSLPESHTAMVSVGLFGMPAALQCRSYSSLLWPSSSKGEHPMHIPSSKSSKLDMESSRMRYTLPSVS